MAKDEKKQRRVKGDAYWKLNGFLKKVQELQKEMAEWQERKAEEATFIDIHTAEPITGVYPDLINWNTGSVYNDGAEIIDGIVKNGKIIGRIDKKIIVEYKEMLKSMNALNEEISEYRDKLAQRLNVWPEQIDWKTGKISTEEFDPEELPADLDYLDASEESEA